MFRISPKCLSLTLAVLMVASLGGYSSPQSAPSQDERITLEVSVGPTGPAWKEVTDSAGHRSVTQVQLELVAEHPRELTAMTFSVENLAHPQPQGGPVPFPDDRPFGGDILIFDDQNNQKRPSIERDSNDYLYTVFEHDEGGNAEIYLAKSTDGGETWNVTAIANSTGDEACPSIAIDYSTELGMEMYYVFYEADELEFAWSSDGVNWNKEDFGGGLTFWRDISCPYVVVKDDFLVLVAERYDRNNDRDTWYILYTLDSFQSTTGYYFNMWAGASIYRPRTAIMDSDEIVVTMVLRDDSDPSDPSYEALLTHATLAGGVLDDDWGFFGYVSLVDNEDYTNPAIETNNREVVFSMELFNPTQGPYVTRTLYCMWTSDYQGDSTSWNKCVNTASLLAYDPTKNQRNPMFYRNGSAIYVVWVNGTDINYRYSPDGGTTWLGEPVTGLPLKVNQLGVGTANLAWHSPDITLVGGKPAVVWHDTRDNGSIYFNMISDKVWYEIDVEPRYPDIYVREVGDPTWHSPPHSYRWKIGTNHTIETLSSYQVPGGPLLDFCNWSDGNTSNPHTITVPEYDPNITAYFCCPVSSLIVETSPPGLLVVVDDTPYTSPTIFCCTDSDVFELYAPSPQPAGPGQGYYFSHWSDGGAQMHNIAVFGHITLMVFFDLLTNQPPIANAGGPYFGRKNFPVNLTGIISYDPDGSIESYEWDFGDGTPHAFGMNVSHTYKVGGVLDVLLNVTDNNGSVSSDTATAAISDYAPGEPGPVDAVLAGATLGDVELSWTLSADDGEIEDDILAYEVYYGTDYDPGGAGYLLLDTLPPGSTSYVHVGRGHGDRPEPQRRM